MIYPIYRTITYIAQPFLKRLLKQRLAKGKEHPTRWTERMGIASVERPRGKLLWIHGASVGESLSALPLIESIQKLHPEISIMITTGTVTSAELMERRLPQGIIHQFMPLDHPTWVERFLEHWHPDGVVWLESELWPNIILSLQKRGINAGIINGRMSEKSHQTWQRGGSFAHQILGSFNFIMAQTDKDATFFKNLGGIDVAVIGNLKFASPPIPYDENELKSIKSTIGKRPFWFFASTHDNEEELAADLHIALKEEQPKILSIIAMRHPNRANAVITKLIQKGLTVAQRSKGEKPSTTTDVYLIDTLGEMGLFFALSDIVAIGGSFIPHGGHNPIEPSAMGCATIVGPHMFNFIEICEQMDKANAIIRTNDMTDLQKTIQSLLQNPKVLLQYKKNGLALADKNRSVLPVFVEKIMPLLTD